MPLFPDSTLANRLLIAPTIGAHSATAGTAEKQTAGTLMTAAEAGAREFATDGFFRTIDTTNGRNQMCAQHIFRLAADGSAVSTGGDYFGANSSFPTVTNGIYELTFYLWFLKTTLGTIQFGILNSQTYTNLVASWVGCDTSGAAAGNTTRNAGLVTNTAAAGTLPVSAASLTDATNHHYIVRALAECATAGNIRLRLTISAGTVTPRRGSYYTARRIPSANAGTFVA